jgi:hypothetical protein
MTYEGRYLPACNNVWLGGCGSEKCSASVKRFLATFLLNSCWILAYLLFDSRCNQAVMSMDSYRTIRHYTKENSMFHVTKWIFFFWFVFLYWKRNAGFWDCHVACVCVCVCPFLWTSNNHRLIQPRVFHSHAVMNNLTETGNVRWEQH